MNNEISMDTRDKADGAFFLILKGMELTRAQQRLLVAPLRQPPLLPSVLYTGIGGNKRHPI